MCKHILLPGQQDVFYEKITVSESVKHSLVVVLIKLFFINEPKNQFYQHAINIRQLQAKCISLPLRQKKDVYFICNKILTISVHVNVYTTY